MRGLLGLIQWLSTAFVTFTVIAWIAVGTPVTTTKFLWFLQDLVALTAEQVSNVNHNLQPDIGRQRDNEEFLDDAYQGYYQETERKLGQHSPGERSSR